MCKKVCVHSVHSILSKSYLCASEIMHSSIPATFFALTLGLLLHPISTGSHHGSTQRHLQKRLEDVFRRFSPLVTSHANLNYQENCISPYEEKLRQQIMEELHQIATGHATLGRVKDVIKKMEEFISMNDKELCNYRLFLVCDQESRKCVCGPSRVNVTYVWEEDKCRYAEGSMCSVTSKIDCSRETRCISLSSLGEECGGGACFCQREFFPTTTVAPLTTQVKVTASEGANDSGHVPILGPPEVGDGDEDDEDNNVSSGDDRENEIVPHRKPGELPTRETFGEGSSSEEDPALEEIDDDDDAGDGEREQIIVVKLGEMENKGGSLQETTILPLPPSQEEEYRHGHGFRSTTTPTPIGTSPVPTRRQELTTAIRRLEREVEITKTLGFGDECFSLSEESDYAEYRRLVNDMDCVTGENDEENLIEILGKLESILEGGNMMCNTTLHLQCDSQSKKCKCRTSSEDLDGFYLLFTEEGKKCVLVENSRCLSREYLISKKWSVTDIPCASEAKCIAQESKAECKSKIENCFCRKPPAPTTKPVDAGKQKKSKSRGGAKTSSSGKPKPAFMVGQFKGYFQMVVFVGMIVYLLMLPRLVMVI